AAGPGIDADPFDCAPSELGLALIVRMSRADRLSKICDGVPGLNELQWVEAQRVRRHKPERLVPVERATELGCGSARAGELARIGGFLIPWRIVQEDAGLVRRRLGRPNLLRAPPDRARRGRL